MPEWPVFVEDLAVLPCDGAPRRWHSFLLIIIPQNLVVTVGCGNTNHKSVQQPRICAPPPSPPFGASNIGLVGETRRAPSRHNRDARVYGHTTAAMHKMSTHTHPAHKKSWSYNSLDCDLCRNPGAGVCMSFREMDPRTRYRTWEWQYLSRRRPTWQKQMLPSSPGVASR